MQLWVPGRGQGVHIKMSSRVRPDGGGVIIHTAVLVMHFLKKVKHLWLSEGKYVLLLCMCVLLKNVQSY